MIVVSNRVSVPEERAETFVERLKENHGIEEQPGFHGLKLLEPVDAPGFVTMTFWDSLDDYETWRDGEAYDRAHSDRSVQETFEEQNDVEIHEVIVNRTAVD